jgi:hypothetical protein
MATGFTITLLLAAPASTASKTSTPTDRLSRPIQLPREPIGEPRAVHPGRAVGVGVCVTPLRKAVKRLRSSTWRWEDKLGQPRHRTERREQRALGCRWLKWIKRRWARLDYEARKRWRRLGTSPVQAIYFVWAGWGGEAGYAGLQTVNV